VADRPTIDVPTPPGGWGMPWPNVAEIAAVFPHENWTLVGGLMTQLHAVAAGVDTLRPTDDVDMVLHIETARGLVAKAAQALEALGYEFAPSIDDRNPIAHQFIRPRALTNNRKTRDVVDLLRADHAAPRIVEPLKGKTMVAIEGGTQALRRTMNARLQIVPSEQTEISVPSPFGALVLKAAAYQTDSRDKERHLSDAALLLAVITDPFTERDNMTGSDRRRINALVDALPIGAPQWRTLVEPWRTNGQTALQILAANH